MKLGTVQRLALQIKNNHSRFAPKLDVDISHAFSYPASKERKIVLVILNITLGNSLNRSLNLATCAAPHFGRPTLIVQKFDHFPCKSYRVVRCNDVK